MDQTATELGIPKANLVKWHRNRDTIITMANNKQSQSLKSAYNRTFLGALRNLEEMLAQRIRARRRKGLKAKRLWIMATARQLLKMPVIDQKQAANIKLSRGWYYT